MNDSHSPFRIAFLCTSRSWGGLELNVARLAGWLTERGHSVTLFSPEDTRLTEECSKMSLPVVPVRKQAKYMPLRAAFELRKKLGNSGARFLWVFHNADLDLAALVHTLAGDRLSVIYQQHMRIGIPKRDAIHTWRYRKLDAWVTLLPYMAKEIREKTRYNADRVHVIPLGLETQPFLTLPYSKEEARRKLGIASDTPLAGLIGRLDPQKGQYVLLEAMDLLRQKGIPAEALILGDPTHGEGEQYAQELRSNYGREGIHFRGFNPDVALFYAAIDIFVLCSYGETYGMVTIEAMLAGVPVIATDSAGTPEILEHGELGTLCPPRDASALAECIEDALGNPVRLAEKAARAKEAALARYDHREECLALEELMKRLS